MKNILSTIILSLIILSPFASAQITLDYLPDRQQQPAMGAGLGVGGYAGAGTGSFQSENQQSIPIFQNTGTQYNTVKVNSSCPLLTTTAKEDTDLFSDLKSFLTTASKKCSLSNSNNNNGMNPYMNGASSSPDVSMFEAMIRGESSSAYSSGTSVSSSSVKCYSKNVELIGQRNLAYYYAEKKMAPGMQSSFSSCFTTVASMPFVNGAEQYAIADSEVSKLATLEKQKTCISEKYEGLVEENKILCKEINAPQSIQAQINKGLVGIEDILNQAIVNKDECGFKTQDLFKVTMNTFLKAKALSVVGPWGAVAGFGADLVGKLLDKIMPNDPQKATAFLDEILNEETFEQNACLYYNIQQKMYCEDRPIEVATMNPSCQNIVVSNDVLNLIQKYKAIQKVTDSLLASSSPGLPAFIPNVNAYQSMNPVATTSTISPELESELVDHLDELANHAIASETDLKDRIKSLPRIQQSREQLKLDVFIKKMHEYQSYSPEKDPSGEQGKKIINDIASFFTGKNGSEKWDLSMFVVKTTPGTKLENLKQRSIARVIEGMLASQERTGESAETSRTMARYNKYKSGVSVLSRDKFETRLEKQFIEFETQVKFVASRDQGKVMDSVAEGQLRNLVRHCTLLQEVYDPNLEGRIPKVCQKLSCPNNGIEWFRPQANQQNFATFKKSYCDKSLSFHKVENNFIQALQDKSGAKICGTPVGSFF